jgi:mRNA-degrading endonuclease RelE of RelBE toxin-antitoxin system
MASYRIEWKTSASRELRSLPKDVLAEIVARVTDLGDDPFPAGVKKLAGAEQTYRIRSDLTVSSIRWKKTSAL